MNEEAQLPTPTTATLTSSRWRPAPFADPFFVLIEVLLLVFPPAGAGGRRSSRGTLRRRAGYVCDPSLPLGELLAHVPDPLYDREHREAGEQVDRRLEQLEVAEPGSFCEHQAGRQHDDPH